MAWPGSYMPAPMVMTHPRHRSRPATAATRSSLMRFWKSTMMRSGFFKYEGPSATAPEKGLMSPRWPSRPLMYSPHVNAFDAVLPHFAAFLEAAKDQRDL